MIKLFTFLMILFLSSSIFSQYEAAPDSIGTSAIHKDSSIIIDWATNLWIYRGYLDINDKNYKIAGSNRVNYGNTNMGVGEAQGNSTDCISLGDSGVAIVTFASTIYNGQGPDFAIFENSFGDNYLELAFVEVSSDGSRFVRFPSISEFPCQLQVGPYAYADLKKVNNLAGKYRQGFGTPFDLEELKDSIGLDINAISHIKLIDVIGSVTNILSLDSKGDTINDCYPTPFPSGGFDLEAVGVMYLNELGIETLTSEQIVFIYPNPTKGIIYINPKENGLLTITDVTGKILFAKEIENQESIDVSKFTNTLLHVSFRSFNNTVNQKILVE